MAPHFTIPFVGTSHRGINLSRTLRTLSVVDGVPLILLRRKGWPHPKWEQLLKYDEIPCLSPFHVMQAYVQKTSFVAPGGPLLWSLVGEKPLLLDTLKSIAKNLLAKFGILIQLDALFGVVS